MNILSQIKPTSKLVQESCDSACTTSNWPIYLLYSVWMGTCIEVCSWLPQVLCTLILHSDSVICLCTLYPDICTEYSVLYSAPVDPLPQTPDFFPLRVSTLSTFLLPPHFFSPLSLQTRPKYGTTEYLLRPTGVTSAAHQRLSAYTTPYIQRDNSAFSVLSCSSSWGNETNIISSPVRQWDAAISTSIQYMSYAPT